MNLIRRYPQPLNRIIAFVKAVASIDCINIVIKQLMIDLDLNLIFIVIVIQYL